MLRAIALALVWLAAPVFAGDFRTLEGHGGPIMDVAISDDGQLALTASFDNSVGLWDLTTGAVRWLEGHEAAVKTAVFVGDDRAASAGDDFAVEVWALAEGTELLRLEGHRGQINGLAVSRDGTRLASASWDGTIGLWDLTSGTLLKRIEGHSAAVNDVAFGADGSVLYSASADGTIRLWDGATGAEKRVVVRHGFGVTKLLLNEAGDWLLYGGVDGGTRALSLSTDEELADLTLDRRPILALAARADMGQVAVGDGEGFIMIVDTADWSIRHDFRAAKTGPIWALAYTPDGTTVAAGGIDDIAFFWPLGETSAEPVLGTETRSFLTDPSEMSNGERQFRRKCSICHSLTDDGVRRAGPSLAGLFGRPAGTVPGYRYSQTMAESGIVWSAETIDLLFDLGPDHYVPGTKMPMQRITSPDDRADLIEFLRLNTSG